MMDERPMSAGKCCQCGCRIWLTPLHYYAAMEGRSQIWFHCGYGHRQHFSDDDSEIVKIRRERDRLKQQLAQRDDELQTQSKLIANLKKQRAVTAKRISRGVCPVCNRTFSQMARHMATKHKEFICEADGATQHTGMGTMSGVKGH